MPGLAGAELDAAFGPVFFPAPKEATLLYLGRLSLPSSSFQGARMRTTALLVSVVVAAALAPPPAALAGAALACRRSHSAAAARLQVLWLAPCLASRAAIFQRSQGLSKGPAQQPHIERSNRRPVSTRPVSTRHAELPVDPSSPNH